LQSAQLNYFETGSVCLIQCFDTLRLYRDSLTSFSLGIFHKSASSLPLIIQICQKFTKIYTARGQSLVSAMTIGVIATNAKLTTVSMNHLWQHPDIYVERCNTDGKFAASVNNRRW
jgi:hypothetical protein